MRQLFFDCDGVLVDSEYIAAHQMVQFIEEMGHSISLEYYMQNCTGRTFSAILKDLVQEGKIVLPVDYLSLLSEKIEHAFSTELKTVQGMEAVVSQFGQNAAVVSNSDPEQILNALTITKLKSFFPGNFFSAAEVPQPKPAPDVYLNALQVLNAEASLSWTIEDSLSGAKAAKAAGLNVIGFLGGKHIQNGHKEKLLALGVNRIAEHANELQNHLMELNF